MLDESMYWRQISTQIHLTDINILEALKGAGQRRT